MIQLYNDYVIMNDDLQWILARDTGKTRKDGKARYDNLGYFGTLQDALKEFRQRNIRDVLKNNVADLVQAIAVIREEDARLEKFIQDNIPDA